jgi:ParB family transcriptional regulator, chromosome partitioning protein
VKAVAGGLVPDREPVVRPIRVEEIKTADLEPNPHNPRVLFDPAPMKTLEGSIQKVGILVPLTVYEKAKSPGKYVILDGQRRWICAQKVKLVKVPVNIVAEPSPFQNIVTMFQIHKYREDWELMPTALKVKVLMNEMKESSNAKLAELTGMDEAVITRCKKLLSFDGKYQEMMLHPDPDKRWKADFFIELHAVRGDRVVNTFSWFDKNDFTDAMTEKYTVGGLKSVTDFRVVKQHISNAAKSKKVPQLSRRFKSFVDRPELRVEYLEIEGASVAAQVRQMTKEVGKVWQMVSELDVEQFYGEDEFWDELEKLVIAIRKKLKEAGRRVKG